MDAVSIATSVLSLVAGVGVFLVACSMMSANLEALGSRRLKSLFSKTTENRLAGVGVGAAATAVIQSSSATTVMVIGFVNAGIMTLAQAAAVIFGANIGTTVTGQLVALGMFGESSVSTSIIFATFAGIGAFILAFAKSDKAQRIGGITAGFGMLFVGLSMMSGAMGRFSEAEPVRAFLATFENPLLLVLIGALLTAVVQSSSVMTSMTITMVVTGLIDLEQGIYLTMGANVGTCVTALIAGFTSTKNAKRTALIHLIFNVSGVVAFLLIGLLLRLCGVGYGYIFGKIFPHAPQLQLAMFHTVFNTITVIIVLPLTRLLVKLVTRLVPDKGEGGHDDGAPRFRYVEEHMLSNPPVAVQQIKREILDMASVAATNFDIAVETVCTLDYGRIKAFRVNEIRLNFINRELARFVVRLLKSDLGERDRVYLSTAFRTVSDLERVGDYAENIVEYADKLRDANEAFSDTAVAEITELKDTINALYASAMDAYKNNSLLSLSDALETEERVDALTARMAENHIKRMSDGACTPEVGAQYLSLSTNAERVADHFINVAKTIKDVK